MEIRPLTFEDLRFIAEIDATIESPQYLHLEKTGEGIAIAMKIEPRPLREKKIIPNLLDDDLAFWYRQIATGADEGIALAAEHDGQFAAAALALPDHAAGTMRLRDVRVDSDFRRQGLGTAMAFQITQAARDAEFRAVAAESLTNNFPASQFLLKTGFEIAGLDSRRRSNHDIVKESATLIWYATLGG